MSRPRGRVLTCSRTEAQNDSRPRGAELEPGPRTVSLCLCQASQTLISGLSVFTRASDPGSSLAVSGTHRNFEALSQLPVLLPVSTAVAGWLPGLRRRPWKPWTTVCIPALYSPVSVLIKQLTDHILYSSIYMHFSYFVQWKLQIHKALLGGVNGFYLHQEALQSGKHVLSGFGGCPLQEKPSPQLFSLPLHASVHSFSLSVSAQMPPSSRTRRWGVPDCPTHHGWSVPLPWPFSTARRTACHFVLICSPPGMSAPLQHGLSFSCFITSA